MASKFRGNWLVRALIVLGVAGSVWAGVRYWAKPQSTETEYKTSPVTRGDITQSVTANGALSPVQLVEVGSQISGVITEINVDFNSQVKAGQIVAQIDPATYQRGLAQAKAELANADAAEELAQLNFARGQELSSANLISKSEFDELRVNLSQAKAQVQTRQSNVDRAEVDLSRTTIHAPIDGIVITRKVEAGQTVAATMNTPTLFTIANDLRNMQIEAAVAEADIGGVEEGQKVQFTVDAFPGQQFEGVVKQVRYAPSTNQNVVTYTSVVKIDNKDRKLRPGMTATARFITSERKNVLKIPNAAVRFRPPPDAVVVGETNAATSKPATVALIESGPFAGLPVMPWQTGGERRRPTDEERTAYMATLTPEQKQKYEKIMSEFRARMAQGGGPGGGQGGGGFGEGSGGGGGSRPRPESTGPRTATVYVKDTAPDGQTALRAVTVKLGIADGGSVEVLEGLKENDQVVSGTVATAVATTRNPLGNPFGGPGRR